MLGPLMLPTAPRAAWRLGFPPSWPRELAGPGLLLAMVVSAAGDHHSAGLFPFSGRLLPGTERAALS